MTTTTMILLATLGASDVHLIEPQDLPDRSVTRTFIGVGSAGLAGGPLLVAGAVGLVTFLNDVFNADLGLLALYVYPLAYVGYAVAGLVFLYGAVGFVGGAAMLGIGLHRKRVYDEGIAATVARDAQSRIDEQRATSLTAWVPQRLTTVATF